MWIVVVCHTLTYTAVVEVKASIPRSRAALRSANAPLADHTRSIASLLHYSTECRSARLKAHLTLNAWVVIHHIEVPNAILNATLDILSNLRVTHILTRNQTAARRRGYRCCSVHIGKSNTVFSQRINIRSLGLGLTIAAKVAIAGIIHKDKDDIRSVIATLVTTTCHYYRGHCRSRNSHTERCL